jgi:hypothetical protein
VLSFVAPSLPMGSFPFVDLTKLGEKQSIDLGQRLRHEMYPDAPGGGILRLHSTFRHGKLEELWRKTHIMDISPLVLFFVLNLQI